MSGLILIWAIDAITALGKVDVLSTIALSIATTSLSPKPLNIASFYLVADSLIDNLDIYIEDSNSIMAEPLDTLQLLNNNYFTVQFIIQIIKEYITVYSIIFQVFYKASGMPTYYLYKTVSVRFMDANITGDIKVSTANTVSLVT